MTERLSVEVTESIEGQRIDRVVSLLLEVSRNVANEVLADRLVSIDGEIVTKPSTRVEPGQLLELPDEVTPPELGADASVVLSEVYADEHVLVVDKPAGMVVHPGAGVSEGTMVQGLLHSHPGISGVGERGRPGIVHRLDKGTSGLVMVALTEPAYQSLTGQLRDRSVGRQYLALVHGDPQSHEGVIDAPIGRSLRHPTRQTLRPDGKQARTSFEVLDRLEADGEPLALLQFVLETGRTHQIRVHADAIGLPLVGDDRYGAVPVPASLGVVDRPLLHARYLAFDHPETGARLDFHSDLPEDFARVLGVLGSASSAT